MLVAEIFAIFMAYSIKLASILIGFGYGNMQSCCQAISIKSVPAEKIGLSTATFSIFLDVGFGTYLLRFFITVMSYSHLYAFLAVIVLCTIVLYYLLYPRRHQKIQIKEIVKIIYQYLKKIFLLL